MVGRGCSTTKVGVILGAPSQIIKRAAGRNQDCALPLGANDEAGPSYRAVYGRTKGNESNAEAFTEAQSCAAELTLDIGPGS